MPFLITEHCYISSELQLKCPCNSSITKLLVCKYPDSSFLSKLCSINSTIYPPWILPLSGQGGNSLLCLERHCLHVFTSPSEEGHIPLHSPQAKSPFDPGLWADSSCSSVPSTESWVTCSSRSLKGTRCTDTSSSITDYFFSEEKSYYFKKLH